eukprot:CAMPEP_0179964588 /NCGR_PEP_ID=MMETSP0983-20121128/31403_1 /TAXON_ID=483367 /ORGANISM="non described non described, Strain CCMP 2436" /LENGTH=133 /DNA_ID=CAMNT_0021877313 /DNA_START=353 /DNA_END=751 /DNA_ORIENTATION=+
MRRRGGADVVRGVVRLPVGGRARLHEPFALARVRVEAAPPRHRRHTDVGAAVERAGQPAPRVACSLATVEAAEALKGAEFRVGGEDLRGLEEVVPLHDHEREQHGPSRQPVRDASSSAVNPLVVPPARQRTLN